MTKDMNAVTCDGQHEPSRTSTNATHCGSTTGTIKESCSQSSSLNIAAWVCHVLRYCITKVSRWTRSLEGRVAEREGRTKVPVYDIIEAGPCHRFWTVGVPCSNCVLGLGYGMGAVKFIESCKAQGLDLPSTPMNEWPELDRRLSFVLRSVAGIRGDFFTKENQYRVGQVIYSLKVVDAWRRANHKIVDKWKELEAAFKTRAMANKETVAFRLPSGRVKRYWNPQLAKEPTVEVDENGHEHPSFRIAMRASVTRGGTPSFFTGGTLLENIIQATARDLLMGAIVEACDKHPNWRYVFNVYDEVILDVPTEESELAEKMIPHYMTAGENIKWADGLMLAVEGGISQKYHK